MATSNDMQEHARNAVASKIDGTIAMVGILWLVKQLYIC